MHHNQKGMEVLVLDDDADEQKGDVQHAEIG